MLKKALLIAVFILAGGAFLVSPVTALGPAFVFMFPEDDICWYTWVDEELNFVIVEGEGILVAPHGTPDHLEFVCYGQIPDDLPRPRDILPLFGVPHGAGVFTFENTGEFCFPAGIQTTDWLGIYTPEGQVTLRCRIHPE